MSEKSVNSLNELGSRGLVLHQKGKYKYLTQDAWRAKASISTGADQVASVAEVRKHGAVYAKIASSVFVNLDALKEIEKPGTLPKPTDFKGRIEDVAVLVCEGDRVYPIKWDDALDLIPEAVGDAGVLVKRGAVLAAIPRNSIPSGTYCVLINLDSI